MRAKYIAMRDIKKQEVVTTEQVTSIFQQRQGDIMRSALEDGGALEDVLLEG